MNIVSVLLLLVVGIFIIGRFFSVVGGGVRLILVCVLINCVVVIRLGDVLLCVVCLNLCVKVICWMNWLVLFIL